MCRIPSRRALFASTLLAGLTPVAVAGPPAYTIVDLGVLGEGTNPDIAANATGMNELGHVAGLSEDDDLGIHAVLWRDGEIVDLGSLPDGNGGYAKGVNDVDGVVGWASSPPPDGGPGSTGRPFVWTEETGMVDPAYPEGFNGECWGINNSGQLALTLRHAHAWDPTKGLLTIKYDDDPGPNWGARAWEVNNNGIVCGESRRANGFLHAFRYDIATETIEELEYDVEVDRHTIAYGNNDRGDVAGYSSRLDDLGQAIVWAGDGRTIRFPLFPFEDHFAYDSAEHINNYGDVVGTANSATPFVPNIGWIAYDVLGEAGPAHVDLRTVLSPDDQAAWTYLHPFEINDRGQICGIGIVNGSTRAFLMTPCVPEGDVDLDGMVGFSDVLAVLAAWGGSDIREDCDRDGSVGFSDLVCVLSNWGTEADCGE